MARPALHSSKKFRRLVIELDGQEALALGCLEFLWQSCHEDGNPIFHDLADIEAASKWPGKKGFWAKLLIARRWLDKTDEGRYQVHDYWHHCPDYVRKRKAREDIRKKRKPLTGQRRTTAANGRTPAPAPAPAPTPARINPRSGSALHTQRGGNPRALSEVMAGALDSITLPQLATTAIWNMNLAELSQRCATYEKDGPTPKATAAWSRRITDMAALPGGLDFLRDRLQYVENSQNHGESKGLGRFSNPAAYLNKETSKWIATAQIRRSTQKRA